MDKSQAKKLIEDVVKSVKHNECLTCDCFVGFIVQIELDCDEDIGSARPLFELYKSQNVPFSLAIMTG